MNKWMNEGRKEGKKEERKERKYTKENKKNHNTHLELIHQKGNGCATRATEQHSSVGWPLPAAQGMRNPGHLRAHSQQHGARATLATVSSIAL